MKIRNLIEILKRFDPECELILQLFDNNKRYQQELVRVDECNYFANHINGKAFTIVKLTGGDSL